LILYVMSTNTKLIQTKMKLLNKAVAILSQSILVLMVIFITGVHSVLTSYLPGQGQSFIIHPHTHTPSGDP